jgi:hypothetical protein
MSKENLQMWGIGFVTLVLAFGSFTIAYLFTN